MVLEDDTWAEEHRNVTGLIRVVASLAAWMALSAGIAMALWDFDAHVIHISTALPLGAAFVALAVFAPKVATRFVD